MVGCRRTVVLHVLCIDCRACERHEVLPAQQDSNLANGGICNLRAAAVAETPNCSLRIGRHHLAMRIDDLACGIDGDDRVMDLHSGGTLAAVVTKAGGLGAFGWGHPARGPDWLRAEIELAEKADGPFAICFGRWATLLGRRERVTRRRCGPTLAIARKRQLVPAGGASGPISMVEITVDSMKSSHSSL